MPTTRPAAEARIIAATRIKTPDTTGLSAEEAAAREAAFQAALQGVLRGIGVAGIDCARCRGTGYYQWGASVNGRMEREGACFSCNGAGCRAIRLTARVATEVEVLAATGRVKRYWALVKARGEISRAVRLVRQYWNEAALPEAYEAAYRAKDHATMAALGGRMRRGNHIAQEAMAAADRRLTTGLRAVKRGSPEEATLIEEVYATVIALVDEMKALVTAYETERAG